MTMLGTVGFTNDADGRILTIDRLNGVGTAHAFDLAGRLTEIAHTGPAGLIESFNYTLDANTNRVAVQSSAGTEIYTLDELNRLEAVSYPDETSEAALVQLVLPAKPGGVALTGATVPLAAACPVVLSGGSTSPDRKIDE